MLFMTTGRRGMFAVKDEEAVDRERLKEINRWLSKPTRKKPRKESK